MVLTIFRLFVVVSAALGRSAMSRLRRGPVDATWSWKMSVIRAVLHAGLGWSFRLPTPLKRRLRKLAEAPVPRGIRGELRQEVTHLGGIPAERYIHVNGRGNTLLYLHGGAYVSFSVGMYRTLTASLAWQTKAVAYSLDYRLAPEHPFPAALEDALAAYTALLDGGVDPSSIVVAGDSAGGGLALAMLVVARDKGLPMPAGAVCLSPYVDLTLPGASVHGNLESDVLPLWPGHETVDWYTGGTDASHPLVSPTYADLSGLPPLLVFAGGREIFRDDIRLFVERARGAGVAVDFREYKHMFHVWPLVVPWHQDSLHAVEGIAAFVDTCTARPRRRVSEPVLHAATLGRDRDSMASSRA